MDILGVEFDGLPVLGDGLVHTALVPQGGAEVGCEMGNLGSSSIGLPVLGDGLVHTALVPQGDAEVGCGRGSLGVEFDGLPVLGDGLVHTALAMQGEAEVGVGIDILGVEFDGLLVSAMASSTRPLSRRASPRLLWARHTWGRARWPCGTRRWPHPHGPFPPGRCRGCCGHRHSWGRVR